MPTLAHAIHEALQGHALGTALVEDGQRVSRGLLDRHARAAASLLAAHLPFQPGRPPRIGFLATNGAATAVAFLGALYAGATLCPLHATTPLADLRRLATLIGLDAIVADPTHRALAAETGLPVFTTQDLARADSPALAPPTHDDSTPALILTTSGTTGLARAVVVSHRSLLMHTRSVATKVLDLTPADRVLATLPIAHSYGCRLALFAPLLAGASTYIVPRFSASATADLLASAAITFAPVVPTMLTAWLGRPQPILPKLRWILSAGAPLPEALRRDAEGWLGVPVRQGYGLTEASFCCIDAPPSAARPGTVGRPVPGVEVRIVAQNAGDVNGDIEVRGDNLMDGYLDDHVATAEAFTEDGWLRTGDIGSLDADGALVLTDRKKDIILTGGHTVYPAEVENALLEHGGIRAVAVVGRPDPFLGEVVTAFVVLGDDAPDQHALEQWAQTQLPDWKIPRVWRFVRQLPTGSSGKVLRRALRDTP